MTQITFIAQEVPTASRLNQATQGYKFLRRTTYAGSAGSPVGNGITVAVTWFPGSGTSAVYVRMAGGGGGSRGVQAGNPSNTSGVSGGGGGAGYTERWILSGIGSSQAITLGLGGQRGILTGAAFAGGQSRFGSFCSAGGGLPGSFISNSSVPTFIAGGLGGIGSGGNINAAGNQGGVGFILPTTLFTLSGRGGQSGFGGPGGSERGAASPGGFAGDNGDLYGGGAGGACNTTAPSGITFDGGNGAPGFLVVDEYA